VLSVNGALIEAVEAYPAFRKRRASIPVLDLGQAILAPGLINCHCHLELSHLAGKTLKGHGFVPWLKSLVALTAQRPEAESMAQALSVAVAQLLNGHTVHVGDVGSRVPFAVAQALTRDSSLHEQKETPETARPFPPLLPQDSPRERPGLIHSCLTATHFLEAFGFSGPSPGLPASLAAGGYAPPAVCTLPEHLHSSCALSAHSLYSTHPAALKATRQWCRENNRPFSVHLAECPEETIFLREGRGQLYDFFRERILPADWQRPGLAPTAFAERLGLLGPDTLAVHCVQCEKEDISTLQRNGTNCCLCPRSNAFIGAGRAPAGEMAKAGLLLCLGTDGLSSNLDLDMGNEMRAARKDWGFSPQAVLRMATLNGAHALGLSRTLGSLEPGKRAAVSLIPEC
jgi:cytosine/adenosine deaminase-related metal-dependent hydrolase